MTRKCVGGWTNSTSAHVWASGKLYPILKAQFEPIKCLLNNSQSPNSEPKTISRVLRVKNPSIYFGFHFTAVITAGENLLQLLTGMLLSFPSHLVLGFILLSISVQEVNRLKHRHKYGIRTWVHTQSDSPSAIWEGVGLMQFDPFSSCFPLNSVEELCVSKKICILECECMPISSICAFDLMFG